MPNWIDKLEALGRPKPPPKPVKQVIQESKRDMNKSVRELEREIAALKRQEEKLIRDCKAAAKTGNMPLMRTCAKSITQTRAQINKLYNSTAQLQGIQHTMTAHAANHTVANAVSSSTAAMQAMNAGMNPRDVARTAAKFEMESEKMAQAGELMEDALALDDDETEGESADLVNQVLDEIGIDAMAATASAPRRRVAAPAAQHQRDMAEADMDARMANLRH